MKKINYDNAKERITEMLAAYEVTTDANGYKCYKMTVKEFNTLKAEIIKNSTKAFAEKFNYYSTVNPEETMAAFRTYTHCYAAILITPESEEPTPETTLKIKDLRKVLFSNKGAVQFAIVYDSNKHADLENGCTIDYVVAQYGERELKRIEAFENQLILTI